MKKKIEASPEKLAKRWGWCRTQNCPSGSVFTADDRIMCSKCYRIYLDRLK